MALKNFRNTILSVALSASLVSCASTTLIHSQPSGAKLYADGVYLGTTPYTYSDTKIVGATTLLTLKKEGCRDANVTMARSEKFEVGACIGGVLVLVPFLWIMGYNPQRSYELECSRSSENKDPLLDNVLMASLVFAKMETAKHTPYCQ